LSNHRGRKSAAELAVVPISAVQRPEPPEYLSAEEAEVWRLTVGGMRPDWFGPETHPLLRAYCCHVALAQLLERELRATAVGDKQFARKASLHARATRTIVSLARSLRITPQANRRSIRDGSSPAPLRRPWE
jgi:hypothetical protein